MGLVFVEIKLTADTVSSSLLILALTAPTIVKAPSNLKYVHAPWSQHSLLPSESQSFQSENRGVHPNEEHRTGPNAMTQGDIPLQELPASTGSSQFYLQPVSGFFLTPVPSGTLPFHGAGIINLDIANVLPDAHHHGSSLPPPPYEPKTPPGIALTQAEPSSSSRPSAGVSGDVRNASGTASGSVSYIFSLPPLS